MPLQDERIEAVRLGWRCSEEHSQWMTHYVGTSPDGRVRVSIEYQQLMGDSTVWLRIAADEGGRSAIMLLDPWLPGCAFSLDGTRLFLDERDGRVVRDTANGNVLEGTPWPASARDVILLTDLFPDIRRRTIGGTPSPFPLADGTTVGSGASGPQEAPAASPPPSLAVPAVRTMPAEERAAVVADVERRVLEFFRTNYAEAEVTRIEVRPGEGIRVETLRPGILIGRRGATVQRIGAELEKLLGVRPNLHIVEVKKE